ncbi:STAS domain-containing protein [Nonomuraea wenchangensis]|uniref:STAS domain-containing protein n=1 Tax=Nonomuraea wenchangensis TaxID=568860 RepID=UPI00371F57D3
MTSDGLRIDTTRHPHCTVLRARGRLDHAGRVRFSADVNAVWDWSDGPVLVFDLAELDFYDSSVIGVLAMAMQRMEEEHGDGRIILVRPSGHLLSVLRLTDLLSHVELRDSVAEILVELATARPPIVRTPPAGAATPR